MVIWWTVEILLSWWKSDAILKIGNWLYLGAILADLWEICIRDAESHADMVYATKTANTQINSEIINQFLRLAS